MTDGHTVGREWLTGYVDLASLIFFMGVSIPINSGWVFVLKTKHHFPSLTAQGETCYVDGQYLWDGK